MDIIFDYISVGTFWTILLIVHSLLAVATLGALTHQAMSVAMPVRQATAPAGFVTRFRSVYGAGFILGAWIYTKYRIAIRIPLERTGYWKTLGFFELKEHVAALGLGVLPLTGTFGRTRKIPSTITFA